jgi:hypothetical protein
MLARIAAALDERTTLAAQIAANLLRVGDDPGSVWR